MKLVVAMSDEVQFGDAKSGTLTFDDVIESLGFGFFQYKLLVICGLGWAADAMEMIAISFLMLELRTSWGVSEGQMGILGSGVFLGMFIGAYVWGVLADTIGRKPSFIATVLITSTAGFASAFSPNITTLILLRMVVGFGLGGNLPVDFSMFMEFVPTTNRGFKTTIMACAWSLGEVISCSLAWILIPTLGWRYYLGSCSILGFFVLFFRRSIPESPRFLATAGRYSDAWKSLQVVAKSNGKELPEPSTVIQPIKEPPTSVKDLFHPFLKRTTILLWIIWFCDSTVFTGLFLFMPTYYSIYGAPMDNIYMDALLSALVQFPGVVLASYMVEWWGRRPFMAFAFVLGGGFTMIFAFARSAFALRSLLLISKFWIYAHDCVVYTYTPELYPTTLRASGMGAASCVKRLSGILIPLVGEAIIPISPTASIILWGAFGVLGGILSPFIPIETKGRILSDTLSDHIRISEHDDHTVTIDGVKVKSETAPLLQ